MQMLLQSNLNFTYFVLDENRLKDIYDIYIDLFCLLILNNI